MYRIVQVNLPEVGAVLLRGQLGLGFRCRHQLDPGNNLKLGLGRRIPTLLDTCTDDNAEWTQLACGDSHTVALTKKSKVFAWGHNDYSTKSSRRKGSDAILVCFAKLCSP